MISTSTKCRSIYSSSGSVSVSLVAAEESPRSLLGVVVSWWQLQFQAHLSPHDPCSSLWALPGHMVKFLAHEAQCSTDASVMFFLRHPPGSTVQFYQCGSHVGWSQRRAGDSRWSSSCGRDKCRLQVKSGFRVRLHRRRCGAGPCFSFLRNLPCLKAHVQRGCSVLQLLEGSPFLLSH